MTTLTLPDLPEPEREWDEGAGMYVAGKSYTADQMRAYARAALSAAPAAATVAFDADGYRAWVLRELPDDTIIGKGAWWADHLTKHVQWFVKPAAPAAPFNVEAMLTACVPGGASCDPQQVADAIRAYCAAPAAPVGDVQPLGYIAPEAVAQLAEAPGDFFTSALLTRASGRKTTAAIYTAPVAQQAAPASDVVWMVRQRAHPERGWSVGKEGWADDTYEAAPFVRAVSRVHELTTQLAANAAHAQQQATVQPLSDAQIKAAWDSVDFRHPDWMRGLNNFIRAIDAARGITATQQAPTDTAKD